MAVMRDESFGPIIGIQAVADDDEAVAAHGRHRLRPDRGGLLAREAPGPGRARAASMWARPTGTAATGSAPGCPGRVGATPGIGTTLSTYGLLTFTQPRAWHLRQP